jgi:hypothetical protein
VHSQKTTFHSSNKTKTMSTQQSFRLLLLAGVHLLLTSCGNNSSNTEQTKTDTTANVNTVTSGTATPSSSIITTPQHMMVVMHKVANYEKWKMAYDEHDSGRQAYGIHNFAIGRGIMDPNMVLVALKVDDSAKAVAFSKSPSLKQAMSRGGIIGTPKVEFYTALYQDTGTIDSKLRSSVTFTVKDWNTWLKNFEEGQQERTNNGVAVRSYGHDAGEPNKVRVVTALVDSAKAMAYYKSDALRKRMDASGVEGKPDRFIYRIVQRY